MSVDRKSLCECGHPKEAHGPQEYPGRSGQTAACRATIFQNVPNGMNAWPCKCDRFRKPLLVGAHPKPVDGNVAALHD